MSVETSTKPSVCSCVRQDEKTEANDILLTSMRTVDSAEG